MSQAIAALVHAAQAAQVPRNAGDDVATATVAALPPITDDYPYPETSLQHVGFFILFFFPALALIVVALRVYSRVSTKQFGWGTLFAEYDFSGFSHPCRIPGRG